MEKNKMIHKHHIIPRHMGGSDDPSNIIELTVEEHAEAHFMLWKQYGKKEDYFAWQMLECGKGWMDWTGRKHKPETIEKQRTSYTNLGDRNYYDNAQRRCVMPILSNQLIESGYSITDVVNILGISRSSVKRYKKIGKTKNG